MGAKSALLTISDGAVTIEKGKEKPIHVPIAKAATNVTVQKGLFFSTLVFRSEQGKRRVGGLTKKEASDVYFWLQQHWLHHLAPTVSEAANQINAILMSGYPRQSRVQRISKLAKESASSFGKVTDETWTLDLDLTPFRTVLQFSQLKPSDIDGIRRQYIYRKKAEFQAYFDEVETFPLTELQREACIADEDNNLVLAGAGTGKTSTMVGRSGFLIQSNQAKPEQILMLAFANKAAAEMQERIEEKLGDLGIQASTFHKLGKEIIATVEGAQPSISPIAEDDKLLGFHVNQWFAELMEEKWYSKLVIKYFQEHLYAEANPFDFGSEGAYFEYIRANEIRTLKGEPVKGFGECLIANYLSEKGVEYKYEAPYEQPTRDLEYRQYQPDFYLPDFGVYLEHVGIDRKGNTATYVDREKYHQGMAWKMTVAVDPGRIMS